MLVVATVAATVLFGGHIYIASRLVVAPAWPTPWPLLGGVLVAALGISLFVVPIAERLIPVRWTRIIALIPSVWMGAAWLFTIGLLCSDAIALLVDLDTSVRFHRSRVYVLALGLGGFLFFAVPRAFRAPPVKRVRIGLPRWPKALDGYRIAQISDVHIGPLLGARFAESVTRAVNDLRPDLIVITGDLVDGPVRLLADEVAPFANLSATDGVFFVTGNHDHYSRADPWVARLRDFRLTVLRNERAEIRRGEARFDLLGVEDHDAARVSDWREDLPAAVRGRDPSTPAILLAHDPRTFPEAVAHSVDLQLSGHTHGGQIFPFGFLVRLVIPFVAGLYQREQSVLYVSRGTGFWGPPMRLLAPAEITELTLESEGG